MARRMILTLAFVAALGMVGLGGAKEASAQWGRVGVPVNYGYGVGGYNNFGAFPIGGYHAAAIQRAYGPNYFVDPYGYNGNFYNGNFVPVGPVYGGNTNNNVIVIGF